MKMKYVLILIISGILIGLGFIGYPYFQLHIASQAYEKGQLDKTISMCTSLEKQGFKQARLFKLRGKAFLFSRNASSAMNDLEKAVQLNPDDWEVYLHIAYIQLANKEYFNAGKNYTNVINLNPESIEAYNNRAAVYIKLKKYAAAKDDYEKALEINPNSPEVYFNLAKLYDGTNNYDLALKHYNLFLEHSKPDMTDLLEDANNRIIVLEKFVIKKGTQIGENLVITDTATFYNYETDKGNTAASNK